MSVLMETNHAELLKGSVLEQPTKWPGRARLIECASEEQFKILQELPGVQHNGGNPKKGLPAAWYIPQGVVDAGRLAGGLDAYPMDTTPATPSGLALYEHQRRAVSFVRQFTKDREGGVLGADVGTGKVIMSLQALWLDGLLSKPGIICGPLTAAAAWVGPTADPELHYGMPIHRIEGQKNPDLTQLHNRRHFFINYEILPTWRNWLFDLNPAWIIFDEVHLLMNGRAKRSQASYKLSHWHTIERRIGLTGTPVPNYRMDLWNQLRVVQPRQWGESSVKFGCRYCGGHREYAAGAGADEREYWVFNEETNNTELRQRLAGTLLRFTKSETQESLPKLSRRVIEVDLPPDALEEYKSAEQNIISHLRKKGVLISAPTTVKIGDQEIKLKTGSDKPEAIRLRAIGELLTILSAAKAKIAAQVISTECASHRHIVSFSWRRAGAKLIAEELKAYPNPHGIEIYGPIDGSMKQPKRQAKAVEFAASDTGLYVATLGSAGIALNELKQASCVVFSDLHWNPSTLTQAEGRIERGGSPHKKVSAVYLVARGTIDELLIEHLSAKADAAAAVAMNDVSGQNLIADLSSMKTVSAEESLDEICAMLAQMGAE